VNIIEFPTESEWPEFRRARGRGKWNPDQLSLFLVFCAPADLSDPFERALELGAAGRTEEAERRYYRAIEAEDHLSDAYCNLGLLYMKKESFRPAQLHFEYCLSLDPDAESVYYCLAITLAYQQDYGSALEARAILLPGISRGRQESGTTIDKYSSRISRMSWDWNVSLYERPSMEFSRRSFSDGENAMCRSIKTLFNFELPANLDEIRAASLQFVRKVSGFRSPSKVNKEAFNQAVEDTTAITQRLLASLTTKVPSRNREIEAEKARRR
tara:strand:- start:9383 stop:10192 length:810 start_codon:yes stop_codon:yes gene_type:complete